MKHRRAKNIRSSSGSSSRRSSWRSSSSSSSPSSSASATRSPTGPRRPAPTAACSFIGLANYAGSLKDPTFTYSFIVTVVYTVLNMIVINVVSFALAMLVTRKIKGRNVYRAGFFVPNLIGGLILGYVWQFIFNNAIPSLGSIVLGSRAPGPTRTTSCSRKNTTAIIALVIVGTWQYAGYIMVIYVAAIENVPPELHEAAQIDGASPLQRLRAITLPMTAQAFTVTMFLTLVNSFKQFDVNVSLTAGGPSTMFMGTP